jgi:hypothetical protein
VLKRRPETALAGDCLRTVFFFFFPRLLSSFESSEAVSIPSRADRLRRDDGFVLSRFNAVSVASETFAAVAGIPDDIVVVVFTTTGSRDGDEDDLEVIDIVL